MGKIYKLVDNTNGNCYVGSTCEKYLSRRLANHVGDYNSYLKNKRKYKVSSFDIIANGCYEMILIENYPCNSKDELFARERHYVETLQCCNNNIPYRTDKEWRDEHKDERKAYNQQYSLNNSERLKEYIKQYRLNNAERIKEYRRQCYECICGMTYTIQHKNRHIQSKYHIENVKRNTDPSQNQT